MSLVVRRWKIRVRRANTDGSVGRAWRFPNDCLGCSGVTWAGREATSACRTQRCRRRRGRVGLPLPGGRRTRAPTHPRCHHRGGAGLRAAAGERTCERGR
jgi:hypothetical protein